MRGLKLNIKVITTYGITAFFMGFSYLKGFSENKSGNPGQEHGRGAAEAVCPTLRMIGDRILDNTLPVTVAYYMNTH